MQSDDRVIKEEGLDNLTDDELRGACRSRGMRTPYGEGALAFMRKQLQEWLDLSLNRCCDHVWSSLSVAKCSVCLSEMHCSRHFVGLSTSSILVQVTSKGQQPSVRSCLAC